MANTKRPLYRLLITEKLNKRSKTFAGVAFEGNFGSLNICLNPGIKLDWQDMGSVWLTLSPYTGDYNAPEVDPGAASKVDDSDKVEQTTGGTDVAAEGSTKKDNDFPF